MGAAFPTCQPLWLRFPNSILATLKYGGLSSASRAPTSPRIVTRGYPDRLIGPHRAGTPDLVLITLDVRDFSRIPALEFQNWSTDVGN